MSFVKGGLKSAVLVAIAVKHCLAFASHLMVYV